MLEHEPQQALPQTPPPQIPAAQRRVSAEELARAVSALENAKATEQAAGVAPIGQVVDELGLDSTPEEIWAEVQKQRAQRAAEEQAKQIPIIALPAAVFQTPPRRRRWAAIGVILIVLGGGIAHSGFVLTPGGGATQTITVNGDNVTQTINGYGKHIVVNGDGDKIILHGPALSMTVNGDNDTIAGDTALSLQTNGDNDTVTWTGSPENGNTNHGHGNHVTATTP